MPQFDRVIVIVLDSVGIGMLPDAGEYNDIGAHTLRHVAEANQGLHMPHLQQLGLGNIEPVEGVHSADLPTAHYGRMMEKSKGKDTTTGHWELMGIVSEEPFETYPEGFPSDLIKALEKRTGRKVIGNRPASGTQIIAELGEEHLRTGALIVYTSADSVLQIAAHEEVVPLEELYTICSIARELTLTEPHKVVRVIARPFIGEVGAFERTPNRRDYSVLPPKKTVLDHLIEADYQVMGVGKIADIFANQGISHSYPTHSNMGGIDQIKEVMNQSFQGLLFANLVDFDSKYGHRRDPIGYGKALEAFDARLPEVIAQLQEQDLLIITADHGNDPTFRGTDHTREYVPLLIYGKSLSKVGKNIGVRSSFSDVGATIADNFQVPIPAEGKSFRADLQGKQG